MRLVIAGLTTMFAIGVAVAAEKPIRFWNLTSETVTSLRLAPAGTNDFEADLTKGNSDGSVDHDERLAIKSLTPELTTPRSASRADVHARSKASDRRCVGFLDRGKRPIVLRQVRRGI